MMLFYKIFKGNQRTLEYDRWPRCICTMTTTSVSRHWQKHVIQLTKTCRTTDYTTPPHQLLTASGGHDFFNGHQRLLYFTDFTLLQQVVTMHLRNDYPLELEGKNLLKIGYQLENEQTAKKIVEMFDKKPGKAIPIEGWLDENENPFQLHELLEKLPEKLDGQLCKLASLLGLGKNHKTATEEEVGKLVDELRKVVDDPARYRKKSKKVRIQTRACMHIFTHTTWCTSKCKQLLVRGMTCFSQWYHML